MSQYGVVAWDSGAGKWLPTYPSRISPDGANYITQDAGNIQIADARTGAVLRDVRPRDYISVFAYTASGIYAISTGEYTRPGLWRIDPSTGSVTQLQTSSDYVGWALVGDAAVWGTYTTANNVTTIKRMDLFTGVITDIYQPAGDYFVALVGSVGSGVLMTLTGNGVVSAIVANQDGSTVGVEIPAALNGKFFGRGQGFLQDGSTIFFSGLGVGLAAYDPDHGLRVLTNAPPEDMFLLGRCRP